ncbi:MAG TPA: hypothetical protein VEG64_05175 [Candidatus Sulfotelmatobacter sp.]|nr:hypothetical protein [Candidatus Sulfotelmatobacter sp.]
MKEDLHDLAAQVAPAIGLTPPNSDEDLRNSVIRIAKSYGIQLGPEQVTIRRSGPEKSPTFFIAADYRARVGIAGFSFTLHFTPSSAK